MYCSFPFFSTIQCNWWITGAIAIAWREIYFYDIGCFLQTIARVVSTYCCLLLIIVSMWSITYHFLLSLPKWVGKTSHCLSFSIIYGFLLIDLNPKQWSTRKLKLLWSLFTIYASCSSFFPVLEIRDTLRQFSENICSEDDLRATIFGTFVVKFLPCLPLLGFSNI